MGALLSSAPQEPTPVLNNVKLSNCLLSPGDAPKITPQSTPRADPGFILPILCFICLSYSLGTFHSLTPCCCFSLFHASCCPLKGKPSCFTHPGYSRDYHPPHLLLSPGTPVSSQGSGWQKLYTNPPNPDKMNVQLFLFLAAYFSLHQTCSYTLPWRSSTERNFFFFFLF